MMIAEEFDPVCFPRHKYVYVYISRGGRGTRHMKGVGMLVGNFELNP